MDALGCARQRQNGRRIGNRTAASQGSSSATTRDDQIHCQGTHLVGCEVFEVAKGLIFSRKMAIFHGFSPKASTPAMPRQCFPGRFPVFGSTFRLKNGKPPATPEPPMK